jgi:cell wall-associated NlpC family hydrolase
VRAEVIRGDLLFYADARHRINHVTIYVGGGTVISHGSEPGPRKLDMDYRPTPKHCRCLVYPGSADSGLTLDRGNVLPGRENRDC